jgi:uncharacterized metal-binding protein
MGNQCSCNGNNKLIFACSGAADVGELSDRAARVLHREGKGKMYCLSGIGAKLTNFIETANSTSKILAIDGCPVDCARKVLENAGISTFDHIRITDLGFQKGTTTIDENAINTVASKGRAALEVCNEIK